MHKLDKIKNLIAFGLLTVIILTFTILGKEHPVTRWLSATAIILWLIVMIVFNRLKKKDE